MLKRLLIALVACFAFVLAFAEGPRAWMDLNFGDSPEVVHEKMERMLAEGRIARSTYHSQGTYTDGRYRPGDVVGYPLALAGVNMSVSFSFHEDGLYWMRFLGSYRTANFWDAEVMREVATLRDVLVTALGQPSESYAVRRFDLDPYSTRWAYIWRGGDGITRYLGVREGQYQYAPSLVIQHNETAQRIAAEREAERQRDLQDAADGF